MRSFIELIYADAREAEYFEAVFFGSLTEDELALILIPALVSNKRLKALNLRGWLGKAPHVCLPLLKKKLIAALPPIQILTSEGIPRHRFRASSASLHYLNLGKNKLDDEHAKWIGRALPNSRLREIHLDSNRIGYKGAHALFQGLHGGNTSVQVLNLADNDNIGLRFGVGPKARHTVALALGTSRLRVVNMEGTRIGDASVTAIADGIGLSQDLERVDVQRNKIGRVGCEAMACAIQQNRSVTFLNMNWNRVTKRGADILISSLRNSNYSIEFLSLEEKWQDYNEYPAEYWNRSSFREVTDQQRAQIKKLCRKNRCIKRSFLLLSCDLGLIPLHLFPTALELVTEKPDLIFEVLRAKPDLYLRSA